MNMIGANVESAQKPAAIRTDITDRPIHALTLLDVECKRVRLEFAGIELAPAITRWEVRRFVSIVEPIDRAANVSMQPGPVATEGDQVSEGEIGIVPHGPHKVSTHLLVWY
jgi:hypothetical protein